MCVFFMWRKGIFKCMLIVNEYGEVDEKEKEDEEFFGIVVVVNGFLCVGGEFCVVLYIFFEIFEEI